MQRLQPPAGPAAMRHPTVCGQPVSGTALPGPLLLACLLLASLLLAGCVTTGARSAYTVDEMTTAEIDGRHDLRFLPARHPDVVDALWSDADDLPDLSPEAGGDGRFDILALSSGGPDGAFGAGAIKGMAEAGTLPRYEVVTGVSTGALIAPFVFTGPGNEALLEQFYTGSAFDKVLGDPNVFTAIGGASLYPGTRIPEIMKRYINDKLIARVAAEHAKGRRLLIATANLDTSELVIWDMGRIASLHTQKGNELFRSVLRAAIAIPGALPPVEIDSRGNRQIREFHGDAGVLSYFYGNETLVPDAFLGKSGKTKKAKKAPRLDVILHNQIEVRPKPMEPRAIKLAGASASNLTRTSMRLLLDDTIRRTAADHVDMRYAFIPKDRPTVTALEFDAAYMRQTFDLGYRQAIDGRLWHTGPRRRQ